MQSRNLLYTRKHEHLLGFVVKFAHCIPPMGPSLRLYLMLCWVLGFLKFIPIGFVFSLDDVAFFSYFHVDTGDLQQIKQIPPHSRSDQWSQAVTPLLFCHMLVLMIIPDPPHKSPSEVSSLPSGLSFWGNQNSGEGVMSNSHLHVQLGHHQPIQTRARLQSYLP